MMRAAIAMFLALGWCAIGAPASAAESESCKTCREYHAACVKAHSQGACKSEYDICMKHCRKG